MRFTKTVSLLTIALLALAAGMSAYAPSALAADKPQNTLRKDTVGDGDFFRPYFIKNVKITYFIYDPETASHKSAMSWEINDLFEWKKFAGNFSKLPEIPAYDLNLRWSDSQSDIVRISVTNTSGRLVQNIYFHDNFITFEKSSPTDEFFVPSRQYIEFLRRQQKPFGDFINGEPVSVPWDTPGLVIEYKRYKTIANPRWAVTDPETIEHHLLMLRGLRRYPSNELTRYNFTFFESIGSTKMKFNMNSDDFPIEVVADDVIVRSTRIRTKTRHLRDIAGYRDFFIAQARKKMKAFETGSDQPLEASEE